MTKHKQLFFLSPFDEDKQLFYMHGYSIFHYGPNGHKHKLHYLVGHFIGLRDTALFINICYNTFVKEMRKTLKISQADVELYTGVFCTASF